MLLRLVVIRATAIAFVGAAAACPEPFYDDNIGVEGVATEAGSLQGTFALKSQAMDQANTILGPTSPTSTTRPTRSVTSRTSRPPASRR
jgi:hypothetical protein